MHPEIRRSYETRSHALAGHPIHGVYGKDLAFAQYQHIKDLYKRSTGHEDFDPSDVYRWPEGEVTIAKDPVLAYWYAIEVIKDRWPEGEATIAKDPQLACMYAKDVIKDRWPEGEAAIAKDPGWADEYAKFLKGDL
jgi:hypothetical protein